MTSWEVRKRVMMPSNQEVRKEFCLDTGDEDEDYGCLYVVIWPRVKLQYDEETNCAVDRWDGSDWDGEACDSLKEAEDRLKEAQAEVAPHDLSEHCRIVPANEEE